MRAAARPSSGASAGPAPAVVAELPSWISHVRLEGERHHLVARPGIRGVHDLPAPPGGTQTWPARSPVIPQRHGFTRLQPPVERSRRYARRRFLDLKLPGRSLSWKAKASVKQLWSTGTASTKTVSSSETGPPLVSVTITGKGTGAQEAPVAFHELRNARRPVDVQGPFPRYLSMVISRPGNPITWSPCRWEI